MPRARTWRRVSRGLATALSLAALFVQAPRASQAPVPEERVEAAIVAKLPQFVEWPPAALANHSRFDLCVARPNPFGNDLTALASGQAVGGRAIAVREVDADSALADCLALFVPAEADERSLLAHTSSLPVLTIGDSPRFLDEGGMVGLQIVGGRVRFDVDIRPARRRGLAISSQLLQLASTVRGTR